MDGVHVHCVSPMNDLCKIMRDSKSRAIKQTIHTNLVGLFCDAGHLFVRLWANFMCANLT